MTTRKLPFVLALLIMTTGAFAGDATTCKITGYRKARFLFIPYESKVFTIELDAKDIGKDRDWVRKRCSDNAWMYFNRNRGAVDHVTYEFHDDATKKSESGTVLADNRSLDELIHDRNSSISDAPAVKFAVTPQPGSSHPYGTGGSETDPVLPAD